jgi:oxygen-independent coproporphyrinogen-3 oxidase
MDPLSLYLHIPFCQHRCAYCDFNTYTSVGTLQDQYVDALAREIEQVAVLAERSGQKRPFKTIYFGGGTPSLLTVNALQRLLERVETTFDLVAEAEITLEANPDTVDLAYLQGLREIGVNRLSLGVQSAQTGDLALLERTHSFETVIEVVGMVTAAGFENFNLDLIYGLPQQSLSSWADSLKAVLALEPTHLSLYCLTIEPGTPMHRWLINGRITTPDPDLAAEQYEHAGHIMAERGFEHYEISNWALSPYECRHNMTYWRNQEYLGLGAGAYGHANGRRYGLVRQPRVYIRRMQSNVERLFPLSSAVADSHTIGLREAMSDSVITQLRLLQEGLDLKSFSDRFGQTLDEAYDGLATQLVDWGLLYRQENHLLLTERGRFISNQVFYRFV